MSDNTGMENFFIDIEREAYKNRIPLRGTFELTARCNFNCLMCYVHLTEKQISQIGNELTNEQWLSIAKKAKEEGLLYLTLTGGEVFARKGFRELYTELARMGFVLQIFTNGYLIGDEVLEWLSENPPSCIRITLYGTSNEIYEKVCGVKRGFDKVNSAILKIKEKGIPLYLVGTIIKENCDDVGNMVEYARKLGLQFNYSTTMVKPVRGATADVEAHRLEVKDMIGEEHRVENLYGKQKTILESCGSYRKGFWVTWDGKMQLCSLLSSVAVSLVEEEFKAAWVGLNDMLDRLEMPEKCITCSASGFCKRCPGMMEAEIGDSGDLSRFCNKAKELKCYLGNF